MGFTAKQVSHVFLHMWNSCCSSVRNRMSFLLQTARKQNHKHTWLKSDSDHLGVLIRSLCIMDRTVCLVLVFSFVCWDIIQMMTKLEKGSLFRRESVYGVCVCGDCCMLLSGFQNMWLCAQCLLSYATNMHALRDISCVCSLCLSSSRLYLIWQIQTFF